jgi:1-acyl-sn-glycerol-3-phosphate acyltransferase
MLVTLVVVFAVGWLLLSLLALYMVKKIFKKYRNYPRIEVPVNMQAAVRQDFGKWDEAAIIKGCFLRFPLHLWMTCSFLGGYAIIVGLQTILKFPESWVEVFRSKYGRLTSRIISNLVEEFDSSEAISTPIVIANHVSWIDFIYMGTCISKSSFVAKIEVKKVPVFNKISDSLKTLYVDRSSAEARAKIKQQIDERVEEYKKDPTKTYPLIIYPEGTVTNGRSLISFKNGAFEPLCPITIICLKYECIRLTR